MSYSPQAFTLFSPTGCVLPPEFSSYQAYSPSSPSSSPKQYRVLLPARQAYSHWASVGKRNSPSPAGRGLGRGRRDFSLSLPRKTWQSSQLTRSTGFLGPLNSLGLSPITACHCSCVTRYFPR